MTASTPPLVDVIESALVKHREVQVALYPDYYNCACGYRSEAQPTTHQARAVLDALTEAGGVEVQFGVKGEGRVKEYGRDRRSAQLDAKRRRAKLVSRVTTAWTAVEG